MSKVISFKCRSCGVYYDPAAEKCCPVCGKAHHLSKNTANFWASETDHATPSALPAQDKKPKAAGNAAHSALPHTHLGEENGRRSAAGGKAVQKKAHKLTLRIVLLALLCSGTFLRMMGALIDSLNTSVSVPEPDVEISADDFGYDDPNFDTVYTTGMADELTEGTLQLSFDKSTERYRIAQIGNEEAGFSYEEEGVFSYEYIYPAFDDMNETLLETYPYSNYTYYAVYFQPDSISSGLSDDPEALDTRMESGSALYFIREDEGPEMYLFLPDNWMNAPDSFVLLHDVNGEVLQGS